MRKMHLDPDIPTRVRATTNRTAGAGGIPSCQWTVANLRGVPPPLRLVAPYLKLALPPCWWSRKGEAGTERQPVGMAPYIPCWQRFGLSSSNFTLCFALGLDLLVYRSNNGNVTSVRGK